MATCSCATPPGNDQSEAGEPSIRETLRLRPVVDWWLRRGRGSGHGRLCDARGSFDPGGGRSLQLGPDGFESAITKRTRPCLEVSAGRGDTPHGFWRRPSLASSGQHRDHRTMVAELRASDE